MFANQAPQAHTALPNIESKQCRQGKFSGEEYFQIGPDSIQQCTDVSVYNLREGFKKSKWKFKMAFAMKGGGSRGGLECHIPILKNDFFKNHLESFPDCENVFCT